MQLTLVRHGAAPPVNGNNIKRPLLRVDMHRLSKRQPFKRYCKTRYFCC